MCKIRVKSSVFKLCSQMFRPSFAFQNPLSQRYANQEQAKNLWTSSGPRSSVSYISSVGVNTYTGTVTDTKFKLTLGLIRLF